MFKKVIRFQVSNRIKLIYQIRLFGYYYMVYTFLRARRTIEKSVKMDTHIVCHI